MANRRGRPTGFRLSEESKNKIRNSRTGQHHSESTKTKIANSMVDYYAEETTMSVAKRYMHWLHHSFLKKLNDQYRILNYNQMCQFRREALDRMLYLTKVPILMNHLSMDDMVFIGDKVIKAFKKSYLNPDQRSVKIERTLDSICKDIGAAIVTVPVHRKSILS